MLQENTKTRAIDQMTDPITPVQRTSFYKRYYWSFLISANTASPTPVADCGF